MFEMELKLAERFVVGEKYAHRGDPTIFLVVKRTPCYITFLTNDGDTYKKKIRYDADGNEWVEWRSEDDTYVLGTWHKSENLKKS